MILLSSKQKYFVFFGLIFIFIISCLVQMQLLINRDVAWLTHVAKIVWHNGYRYPNILEINSPLAIMIYTPVIFLKKIFPFSDVIVIRIYVFISSFFSLFITYAEIKKIFQRDEGGLAVIFFLTLAFTYWILPLGEFGQREHFILMLTMPYFFLIGCQLEGKSTPLILSFFIGFLAGIGFCIKPFFILTFFMIELYVIFFSRRKLSIIRPEIFGFSFFLMLYLIVSLLFFKDYYTKIVPFAMQFYYQSMRLGWSDLFFGTPVIFCYLSCALYFLKPKNLVYKPFVVILLLALIGFLFAYLIQQIPLYYHLMPVFSVSLLLDVLLITPRFKNADPVMINKQIVVIAVLLFFSLPWFIRFYSLCVLQKKSMVHLIAYLNKNAYHKPVGFISAYDSYMTSVILEAKSNMGSRITFLGWLRSVHNKNDLKNQTHQQKTMNAYFAHVISDDLKNIKPVLVFVDRQCFDSEYGQCIKIPYLRILSNEKHFRDAWVSYSFLIRKKTNEYDFDVYQRKNLSKQSQTEMQ